MRPETFAEELERAWEERRPIEPSPTGASRE